MSENPVVSVIMGSQSDWDTMRHAIDTLEKLGIPCEARIMSAHRTPARVVEYVEPARERGLKVIIGAAGGAAALPGAIAAKTTLPVIGVPMEGWALKGLDALLSMVQMPPGIPVGTVSIGKPGATNAALYAAAILAVSDEAVAQALDAYRAKRAQQILDNPDPSKAG